MNRFARLTLVSSALALATACQTYNVDPVVPKAVKVQDSSITLTGQKLAPNLMFVVDRSGSMQDPANSTEGGCSVASNGAVNGTCKWTDLVSAMLGDGSAQNPGFVNSVNSTLSSGTDKVGMGLLTFASDGSCGAGNIQVVIHPDSAGEIVTKLNGTSPGGATPTAASMALLKGSGVFPDDDPTAPRGKFAILLTDGAPNCNADIPNTEANCGQGLCTQGDQANGICGSDWGACGCNVQSSQNYGTGSLGCLDQSGLVAAVASLKEAGISTFVIGFGQGTLVPAVEATLNQTAVAGGYPRDDATNKYYQASSLDDLNQALLAILGRVDTGCSYQLDGTPPDKALLQVIVTPPGGSPETLTDSQFELDVNTVKVTDAAICAQLSDGSQATQPKIEFRYLSN